MFNALIIDNNAKFCATVSELMAKHFPAINLEQAGDGKEGFSKLLVSRPDVILIDVEIPDESGFELTRRICDCYESIDIVLISNLDLPEYRLEAYRSGAGCFIPKTGIYCLADIMARIEGAMLRKVASRHNRKMN